MKKLNQKGVSLAELLAVVVIMGIIAAIAIPLVGNVIETSKKKAYLGDLVTVAEAARTYCIAEGKSGVGICGAVGANPTGSLDKYISKSLSTIGSDSILVQVIDNVYKVATSNPDGEFSTGGVPIDPTLDNAIDLIDKKSASTVGFAAQKGQFMTDLQTIATAFITNATTYGVTPASHPDITPSPDGIADNSNSPVDVKNSDVQALKNETSLWGTISSFNSLSMVVHDDGTDIVYISATRDNCQTKGYINPHFANAAENLIQSR